MLASDVWFDGNTWVIWLALALTLAAIEAATADFTFLMLACGAAAGAIVAGAGFGFTSQAIAASVVGIAMLMVVRPLARRRFAMGDQLPMGMQAYVGREVSVSEPVTLAGGRVLIDGQLWSARLHAPGAEAAVGSLVYVTSIDGATAVVSPQKPADPVPPLA